jgi:hypothetical protein
MTTDHDQPMELGIEPMEADSPTLRQSLPSVTFEAASACLDRPWASPVFDFKFSRLGKLPFNHWLQLISLLFVPFGTQCRCDFHQRGVETWTYVPPLIRKNLTRH